MILFASSFLSAPNAGLQSGILAVKLLMLMTAYLEQVKKSALWAILLGGSTGFIGILFSMGFAHSGTTGRAVFLLLIWPIEITEALDKMYLGGVITESVSPDMLWLIPQILIYFLVILLVRTVWFTINTKKHLTSRSRPTQL